MDKITRFADIVIGTTFTFGGGDFTEWIKVDQNEAARADDVNGTRSRVHQNKPVLTDDSAVIDILASWGRL